MRNGLSFDQRLKLVDYVRSHVEDLHDRTWPQRAALAEAVVQFPVTGANLRGITAASGVVLREKGGRQRRQSTVELRGRLDAVEALVAALQERVGKMENRNIFPVTGVIHG